MPKKLESCVKLKSCVKKIKGVKNPYAVCTAALKKSSKKKNIKKK